MPYSDFTLKRVKTEFELIEEKGIFFAISLAELSDLLCCIGRTLLLRLL